MVACFGRRVSWLTLGLLLVLWLTPCGCLKRVDVTMDCHASVVLVLDAELSPPAGVLGD